MKINTLLRPLIWIALLIAGFFVGSSWKSEQVITNQSTETEEFQPVLTKNEEATNNQVNSKGRFNPEEAATINLFENAAPSVIYITTTNVRRDYWSRNVTEIPRGSGSGFVWDHEGHIITNYHVIQGADKASVTFADQTTLEATLIGAAPEKDLAVLKIDNKAIDLRPIPVAMSGDLRVGQSVYAIGNPFGLDQSLTTGIISALGREIESVGKVPIRDVIQTDAAINPGNSGGPLLDSKGELIGVNTAIFSPSGAYAGVGFSIPSDVVSTVVPDLIQYGKINRPSLGIELAGAQVASRLDIKGVLILQVTPGSAAARAGLLPTLRSRNGSIRLGDIITGIDDNEILTRGDMILTLEKYKSGDQIKVKILRDYEPIEVDLILDAAR